jgi:hypothetical protein
MSRDMARECVWGMVRLPYGGGAAARAITRVVTVLYYGFRLP